ncbi:LysR family transcriptional regulator [Mucilaginibacter gilvus]|uniref:LysR family transcriptional regulator n=1 Tax=Mucilaginibacter gilvus TaxID=2305909 RepID=A0A3S3VHD8_9SPHI|nr:LysR family transcriptional regulator [Mucilaginibacter gilvus]RWY48389.1 LysR family transcriptional regulator [Mucilaginibacter gilvus]
MDIQQIRNFLKLSEELHFWRTANMINITQSALSRQIKTLEEELGVSLFERNKRNVKLTPSGIFLKNKWSTLLNDLNEVHVFAKKIGKGETGHIRIVHPDSISFSMLPELLARVAESYPGITIDLLQLVYEDAQQSLLEYKNDLAFTRQVSKLPDISSKLISSLPVALFVPKSHSFVTSDDITNTSLAKQQFILPIANARSNFYFFVQEIFKFYQIKPVATYHSDFGSSVLGLISRGLGVAILPISFVHHGTPGIRALEIPFSTDLYVSWRKDDRSPAVLNLLEIIADLSLTHQES